MIATAHLITFSLLFLLSAFSYSHLNWKDDLFLLTLIGLYPISLLSRRLTQELRNYFLIFILIFLLSQFYINNFQPEQIRWWFASIPGWLTLLIAFVGFVSLVSYQKIGVDSPLVQDSDQTFHDLIDKVIPGILVVSLAMFFLFVLNLDEISPEVKVATDYSTYIIIPFGFVLFYSLNFYLKHQPFNKVGKFLQPAVFGVLIFLVGMGARNTYIVHAAYNRALDARLNEKLWQEVLDLNKMLKVKSIDIMALNKLGEIYREKGNYRQASLFYKKVLADQPFDFKATLGIAHIAYYQNKWESAQEAYKRAIYLKPTESNLYSPYIHSCIRSGRISKAIEFIESLHQTTPLTLQPEDYLIIGECFLKEKKLQKALIYLQRAAESMPTHFETYFLLGKAFLESGQYRSGCETLERATQINFRSAEAYHYLGRAYENIHQDYKAISAYERAVSLDAKNMEAFYHLKRLYKKVGSEKKAINMENHIESIATKVIEAAEWKGRSEENVYQNGEMYWAGKISVPVLLKEGNATFIFEARGTLARGVWPRMNVDLDGEVLGQADVTSAELREYKFSKRVRPGKYHLNVTFTNDELVPGKDGNIIEDRNLFVRRCRILYE